MKIKEHDSEVSCVKFVCYLGYSGNYVEFLKNIKINSMMSILAKYKSGKNFIEEEKKIFRWH